MGFYLRCRRLQSGAATQTDSGGRLMAKVPGFAKVYAGRWAHRRNGHQATFANAAGFFNNLLERLEAILRRLGPRPEVDQIRKLVKEIQSPTRGRPARRDGHSFRIAREVADRRIATPPKSREALM